MSSMQPADHLNTERASSRPVLVSWDESSGHPVLQAFLGSVRLIIVGAVLVPFLTVVCTWTLGGLGARPAFWVPIVALAACAIVAGVGLGRNLARKLKAPLARLGDLQARNLETL